METSTALFRWDFSGVARSAVTMHPPTHIRCALWSIATFVPPARKTRRWPRTSASVPGLCCGQYTQCDDDARSQQSQHGYENGNDPGFSPGWTEITVADRRCCNECPIETIRARPALFLAGKIPEQQDSQDQGEQER